MQLPPIVAFLGNLGAGEILFILLIILLLFGAAKIPELARSLGKAQREFQKARDQVEREMEVPPAPPKPKERKAETPLVHEVSDDARVQEEAARLGIDIRGKSPEQLRREIERKLEEPHPRQ